MILISAWSVDPGVPCEYYKVLTDAVVPLLKV